MFLKSEVYIPFGAALAGFCFFSVMVSVSKRHPFFVKQKLYYGALVLMLTGAVSGCNRPITGCYIAVPSNQIIVDQYNYSSQEITLTQNDTLRITGTLYSDNGINISCAITDSTKSIIFKDSLIASDGNFDTSNETFYIIVPQTLAQGIYNLHFFTVPFEQITAQTIPHQTFTLRVVQ